MLSIAKCYTNLRDYQTWQVWIHIIHRNIKEKGLGKWYPQRSFLLLLGIKHGAFWSWWHGEKKLLSNGFLTRAIQERSEVLDVIFFPKRWLQLERYVTFPFWFKNSTGIMHGKRYRKHNVFLVIPIVCSLNYKEMSIIKSVNRASLKSYLAIPNMSLDRI